MLEGLVARVLNSILGKYVQEFDAEGLNVGIFGGNVHLRDLKLKPSCLYELQLPIEVGCGVIGELKLVIPWNYLTSKPIDVTIEDLLLVAYPVGLLSYDEERDKQLNRVLKRLVVERVEAVCGASLQNLLQTLVPMLSHNIQLHVRNVHIRYEDPRAGVAAGIFIQEFSVETTNNKWKPVSHSDSGSSTYQLVRIDALSVYLNAGLDRSQFVLRDDGWAHHMRNALLQYQLKGIPLDFVVKPLNSKLKVIVGKGAPVLVDVVVQDAVVVLSHRQLTAALNVAELFNRIPLHRGYLAIRPSQPVKNNSSAWWRYAYAATLQQRVIPYTWTRLFALRKCYREYKQLYKQTLLQPGDLELRLDLQRAEDNLPLSCIVLSREHAKLELREENPDLVDMVEVEPGLIKFRPHLRRGKSAEENSAPQPFIEYKLNVTVDNLSLSLVRDGREVLAVGLTQCLWSGEIRVNDSWKLSARAGNMLIEGSSFDSELVPILSTSVNSHTGTTHLTCFSLDIEKKPPSETETGDYAVSVTVMPMELIYQEHAFSELLSLAPRLNWSSMISKWWDKLALKAAGCVTTVPWLDVHASVAVPRIVIPESGSLQKGGLVLVVDLGKWDVQTELQPRLTMEEVAEMTQMELEERLYHRLIVQCSSVQMLFTDSGEEWRELSRRDESEAHVVSRARGSLALSLSIKPEYSLLPQLKLNLGLPALHITLSDRRLQQLLDVLETIPKPAARYIMFVTPPPLDPLDQVKADPDVEQLSALARQVVEYELFRQRTPDSLASPLLPEGPSDLSDLRLCARSVVSDASDEELELWARTVDLPGFEDNVSPHNTINALLRVTIGELVVHLPRNLGFQDKPYLMVRLARFALDVAFMQFGPAVQIALGGFQLIDKLHIGTSGEYLEVVSTQSDQDFFSLLYRKVRADCPDFKTHFHAVEQSLVVDVGFLSLVLQRDACVAINKFLLDMAKCVTETPLLKKLPLLSDIVNKDGFLKINDLWKWWGLREDTDPPIPPGGTKYSYSARMNEMKIRLREADADLLELHAGGLEGDCTLRANERLMCRVFLQKLVVEDLGEGTLYPHILSQDEDYVMEIKLVRLSPEARRGLAHGSLKVNLARLHILFAAHIIHTLQRFLELLSGYLPRIAKRILQEGFNLMPRRDGALQLALTLNLPVVLLPPGPTAPSLIILHLGDLTVENFLKDDGAYLIDNILVKLENVFVTRGLITLGGSLESREEILEPMRLSLDVKRVLSAIPLLDIVGRFDAVRICIGQRDLSLLIDVTTSDRSILNFVSFNDLWKREETVDLRCLQAFLYDGNVRRRDSTARFTLDILTVILFTDMDEQLSSPVRDLTHALCKFQLHDGLVSVETRASGLCELRCSVHNCSLDDVRSENDVIVTRVFGARPGGDGKLDSAISVSSPPLIDIVGKQSERGDRCVDVLVEKTRLSLSASFLGAVTKYISDVCPDKRDGGLDNLGYIGDVAPRSKVEATCCSDHGHDHPVPREKGLSLSLQLRRPEVALLADGGVGLVLRCEVLLDYSRCTGRDEWVLRLAGLRIVSIQPAPIVMRPCDVEMVRIVTTAGTQINAMVGAMDFTLCFAAFTACSTILEELQLALKDRREIAHSLFSSVLQVDDLWSAKKIAACCEAALCAPLVEPCLSEPHSFPAGSPAESMTFTLGKITAIFGLQKEVVCRPLFIVKASVKLQAHDWSSAPTCTGEITTEVACWNDSLEVWEPLVELWEVSIGLYQSKALPISPCSSRVTRVRRSQDPPPPAASSDSSGDESEPGMTFLRPEHFNIGHDAHRPEGLSDCSDSEGEEGVLERIRGAVAHLFVNEEGSSGGEASSDEVETESASSETFRSPNTERAVFLNKHADSVDSGLETETVERQAAHVLIQARRRLEISVTPNVLSALELIQSQPLCAVPRVLANHLGHGSIVTLLQQGTVVARSGFDDDSLPSTPGDVSPCHTPSGDSTTCEEVGRTSPDLSYPYENLETLKQRMSETQLVIQLLDMEPINATVGKALELREFSFASPRHGIQYHVTVSTCRTDGITHYVVAGPLQIKNETGYAVGIFYKRSILLALGEEALGESSNPFDDMVRLAVVAPDDCYHVPLTVCYHCKLHFLPAHLSNHDISEEGVSWQEICSPPETQRDVTCKGSDGSVFSIKACWSSQAGPQRTLRLMPPWLLRNLLPIAIQMALPTGQQLRLEAGEEAHVYCINPQDNCSINLEVPEHMGISWSGSVVLAPDCKEKTVSMETEQDTDGGNKQLIISVLVARSTTAAILFYSPYWLLNKTGLPLQIRGSGSDAVQEWTDSGPLFFSFRKQRSRTVRLRVLTSSWSSAFSLDAAGCSGLVVCRDRERKKRYRVVVQCEPTKIHPALCRILTFLPHLMVENACKKHLRFMEDNEQADLWHDIAPGQCLPFWPDTDSLRMVVRVRDSQHVSSAFPITTPHVTALRMDKGCALTVEVAGGEGSPLRVLIRPYRCGDAPVRIDNHCADLFLKLRQKECPQVALLSPYHSLLYTWDDPCSERELLWSVYNNAGREMRGQLTCDGCGEERVSFRSVRANPKRPQSPGSSASSDSDHDPAPDVKVLKETRKDTVVVYWISFLQEQQRVLLLTQDDRLARRARKIVEAERSSLELFIALSGCGLSLSNKDEEGKLRELAYLNIHSVPARWELSVAQCWKPVTADLAAWLENNYNHGVMQPKIKDYINVDLSKMQMSRPLFGSLRRRQRPAVWVQYRASRHLSVLQFHTYRVQLDDQRTSAVMPCVLRAAPGTGSRPAVELAVLWRHRNNSVDVVKFASLSAQEHSIHIDSDWLVEMCSVASRLWVGEDAQSAMRSDIARLHVQSRYQFQNTAGESEEMVVENLHCMPVTLDLTMVPTNSTAAISTAAPLKPVPNVLSSLLCAVATAPTPIVNLPIKLGGLELVGGLWNLRRLENHMMTHYLVQLLQQLHVLVLGVHVLATPIARLAPTNPSAQVMLPEEFSDAVSMEAEARMTNLAIKVDQEPERFPTEMWKASRVFPLGCCLGLSGLAVSLPRGPPFVGLDAFCRGPGRAVSGLLAALQSEPSNGLPDALQLLSDAVARSSNSGENVICRSRPPRYINSIMGLRPFSIAEAQGLALLDSISRGRFNKDTYWSHAPLTSSHSSILLITLQRVLLIEQVGSSTSLNVSWCSTLDAIVSAVLLNLSIVFTFRQGVEITERQIPCWDPEVLTWLYARLQEAIILKRS